MEEPARLRYAEIYYCLSGLLSVSDVVELDDSPAKKDKHYRKYAAAVERALTLFETNLQEWADYISFLNRLLKVRTYYSVPHCCSSGLTSTFVLVPAIPALVNNRDPLKSPYRKAFITMPQSISALGSTSEDSRGLQPHLLHHRKRWPVPRPAALLPRPIFHPFFRVSVRTLAVSRYP